MISKIGSYLLHDGRTECSISWFCTP